MKKILKIVILFPLLGISFLPFANAGFFEPDTPKAQYCNNEQECWITKSLTDMKPELKDIEKERKFSVYAQDVVIYVLTFISIIWVVYIIFAWVTLMVWGGGDKTMTKTKNMITYVIIGIFIMWLAFPLMKFLINILNASA